jgi:exosortase A-associated hydrolase 2
MQAFFLPTDSGQRLCVFHPSATCELLGAVLYVHPFAEEMNKSRRMAALQSRALAQAGFAVLQVDLYGCGDSSGEFGEATWSAWIDDVACAARWLRASCDAPLWLWGSRLGCVLAAMAAERIEGASRFVFWHPVLAGKSALKQFLRLKVAAKMSQGDGQAAMQNLRLALAAGESVEVAGYTLGARLANAIECAALELPGTGCVVVWLELSPRPHGALPPASAALIECWRASGHLVTSHVVEGPAFWQTQEIEVAPALIEATLVALKPQPECTTA